MIKNKSTENETLKNLAHDSSSPSNRSTQRKEPHWLISLLCGAGLAILPPIIFFLFAASTDRIARSAAASWSIDFWVLVGTIYLFFFSKKMQPENRRIIELSLLIGATAMFITKLYFFGIPK